MKFQCILYYYIASRKHFKTADFFLRILVIISKIILRPDIVFTVYQFYPATSTIAGQCVGSLRNMYPAFINTGRQICLIDFSVIRHHFLHVAVRIILGVAVTVIICIVFKIILNLMNDRSTKLACKCGNDHKTDQKLSKLLFLFYRSAALLH